MLSAGSRLTEALSSSVQSIHHSVPCQQITGAPDIGRPVRPYFEDTSGHSPSHRYLCPHRRSVPPLVEAARSYAGSRSICRNRYVRSKQSFPLWRSSDSHPAEHVRNIWFLGGNQSLYDCRPAPLSWQAGHVPPLPYCRTYDS